MLTPLSPLLECSHWSTLTKPVYVATAKRQTDFVTLCELQDDFDVGLAPCSGPCGQGEYGEYDSDDSDEFRRMQWPDVAVALDDDEYHCKTGLFGCHAQYSPEFGSSVPPSDRLEPEDFQVDYSPSGEQNLASDHAKMTPNDNFNDSGYIAI